MPHAELAGELLVCLVQHTGLGGSLSLSSGCSDVSRGHPGNFFCCRNSRPVVPRMTVKNRSIPEMCVPISLILNQEYMGEEQRLKVFTRYILVQNLKADSLLWLPQPFNTP